MTTDTDTGLTAIELAAMRQADDLCFFHRAGRSYIRAVKRVRPSARQPFAQDVTLEIACDTRWTDYTRQFGQCYPAPEFDAFEMCGMYQDGALATTVAMLRKGDALALRWIYGNKNGHMENAGFRQDVLELHVRRGERRMVFHIADAIGPVSASLMVRSVRAMAAAE